MYDDSNDIYSQIIYFYLDYNIHIAVFGAVLLLIAGLVEMGFFRTPLDVKGKVCKYPICLHIYGIVDGGIVEADVVALLYYWRLCWTWEIVS